MSLGKSPRGLSLPWGLAENLGSLRRAQRQGGCAADCGIARGDGDRLPWNTAGLYGGWGGHEFHETPAGAERTPVVFVHGNQRDACDWADHARYFRRRSYLGDELWAVSFRDGSPTHDEMARTLEDFVSRVRGKTGADRVSLVAHSLGVTGVRYWLLEKDRYDWVETFVGLAGANHGTILSAWADDAGMREGAYKMIPFLRADYEDDPDHPLARLNEDETPGDVAYYTIRGTEDPLFWRCEESPELAGARNVVLPVDHDGVRTDPRAMAHIFEWVSGLNPHDLRHQVRPD